MLELTYTKLRRLAFVYMALPCLVFLLTFVRLYVALPCAAMLLAAVYLTAFRRSKGDSSSSSEKVVPLTVKALVVIVAVMLLWSFLGGQGNLWFQTHDWTIRNAIFRDLITRPWPVIYAEKGTALSYYIGHWLVPAVLAKGVFKVAGLGVAWMIGNVLLWLWTTLGLTLVVLLMCVHFGPSSMRKLPALVAIFIFFSGMDVVGAFLKGTLGQSLAPETLHLEWWAYGALQFSSITTCLYWVFNQAVAPWIATMCFVQEKDARNYVPIVSTALLFGPFPALGLAILMLIKFVVNLVQFVMTREHTDHPLWCSARYFQEHALSPQNLLTLLGWCPIVITYFVSNAAFAGGAHSTTVADGGPSLKLIAALLFLDAGAYLILIWRERRREPLFYAVCGLLLVCPFIRVGGGYDFTMRVSIPAIFILMLMCAQTVLADRKDVYRPSRLRRVLLIVCLAIGCVTPLVEIYRGFYHVVTEHTIFLADDETYSIATLEPSINFEAFNYQDTAFFRLFAQ